jgi:hypothetical protein
LNPVHSNFIRSVVEGEEILVRYDLPEGVELVTVQSWYGWYLFNKFLNTIEIAH